MGRALTQGNLLKTFSLFLIFKRRHKLLAVNQYLELKMTSQIELYRTFTPNASIYVSYDLICWEPYEKTDLNEEKVLAYIVLLSDGQIIDGDNEFAPLPEGAYYIEERNNIDKSKLPKFNQIKSIASGIHISHQPSPFNEYDSSLYATQLTNNGSSAFKINRFSSYTEQLWNKIKRRPRHSNLINGWFNSQDFKLWYDQKSEWIQPNETVSDMRNYGDNFHWIYEVEYEDGQIIWVSSYKK